MYLESKGNFGCKQKGHPMDMLAKITAKKRSIFTREVFFDNK